MTAPHCEPAGLDGGLVDEPTDAELVALAKRGDPGAWAQLEERHSGEVETHVSRLLPGDRPRAKAIVDYALWKARSELSSLRKDASFLPWVKKIARHLFLDEVRRRGAWSRIQFDDAAVAAVASEGADPLENFLRRNWKTQSEAAVVLRAELSKLLFEVLVLRAIVGLSQRECSERLGVPIGTVGRRYADARERAAEVLIESGVVDALTARRWREKRTTH